MAVGSVRRHVMLEMRLDLASVDPGLLASLAGRLEEMGLTVSTLRQEREQDSSAVQRAYHCHMECRKRQPPVELRQEPILWEGWQESIVTGAEAMPDAYFIAKANGEYVGVCLLHRVPEKPRTLICGFTGTLPAWSGQGIAKALKAHSLLFALQNGWEIVETSVLQVNRSMCAINRALAFQRVSRRLHSYPIPAPRVGGKQTKG